jgi:hypothetical protein
MINSIKMIWWPRIIILLLKIEICFGDLKLKKKKHYRIFVFIFVFYWYIYFLNNKHDQPWFDW